MNPTIDFADLPLRDIHLPGALSWWPPAAGWWLLAGVAAIAIAFLLWHRHRNRHRRAALAALDGVVAALEQGEEPVHCLQQASSVLRRFAITAKGTRTAADASGVAGLTGERWLGYLDRCWGGRRRGEQRWGSHAFLDGVGRGLAMAPYRPPQSVTTEQALELSRLCAAWIRAQRTEH